MNAERIHPFRFKNACCIAAAVVLTLLVAQQTVTQKELADQLELIQFGNGSLLLSDDGGPAIDHINYSGGQDMAITEGSVPSTAVVEQARARYARAVDAGLSLDLTRGKPSPEQLDLSTALLGLLSEGHTSPSGIDCRNYGGLEGLPEARALFAQYLEVEPQEVWVQGNSSLRLMYDTVSWCHSLGTSSGSAWSAQGPIKFLCPTPGYDRHFHLLAHLGFELIPVKMTDDGPDLETVQRLVRDDASVKGMFCVPRFSNPTGTVYSDETVQALASMVTAAPDFRVFWDNAYARHSLVADAPELRPFLDACKSAGQAERALIFGSTSKVTLAGAGLSMIAVAGDNQRWLRSHLSMQAIGPNKLTQLAHLRFFDGIAAIDRHMEQHASLLRPRFAAAADALENSLGPLRIAQWSRPEGGYFISLDTLPGCATRTVELAAAAGVKAHAGGCHLALQSGCDRSEPPLSAEFPERKRSQEEYRGSRG